MMNTVEQEQEQVILEEWENTQSKRLMKQYGLTIGQAKLFLCLQDNDRDLESLAFKCWSSVQGISRMAFALSSKDLAFRDGSSGEYFVSLTEKGRRVWQEFIEPCPLDDRDHSRF